MESSILGSTINHLIYSAVGKLTIIFIVFIIVLGYKLRDNEKAPTILTTLGILGTFVGISIGLARFNPNVMQSSINQLLNGLKTAFFTSIAGVLGSLILKIRSAIKDKKEYQGATVEDIVNSIEKGNKKTNEKLEELMESLTGDDLKDSHLKEIKDFLIKEGEGNLSHQVVKMRQKYDDMIKKQKEMFEENKEILQEIKKSLTGESSDEGSLIYHISMLREKNNDIEKSIEKIEDSNDNYFDEFI